MATLPPVGPMVGGLVPPPRPPKSAAAVAAIPPQQGTGTPRSAGFEDLKMGGDDAARRRTHMAKMSMSSVSRTDDYTKILQGKDLLAYITALRTLMLPLLGLRGQRSVLEQATSDPPNFVSEENMRATWLQYSVNDLNCGMWDLYVSDIHPNIHIHNDLGRRDAVLRRLKSRLADLLEQPSHREIDRQLRASVSEFLERVYGDSKEQRRLQGFATPQEVYLGLMRTFYDVITTPQTEGRVLTADTKDRCTEEFRLLLKDVLINQTYDPAMGLRPKSNMKTLQPLDSAPMRSRSVSAALDVKGHPTAPRLRASVWQITPLLGSADQTGGDGTKGDGASTVPYVSVCLLDMIQRLRDAFEVSESQHATVLRSELALHGHRHVLVHELRQRQMGLDTHPHYRVHDFECAQDREAWRAAAEEEIMDLLRMAADAIETEKDTFTGTLYVAVLDAGTHISPGNDIPFESATEIPLVDPDPLTIFPPLTSARGFLVDVPYPVRNLAINLWDDEDVMDTLLAANMFNPWAPNITPDGPPIPPSASALAATTSGTKIPAGRGDHSRQPSASQGQKFGGIQPGVQGQGQGQGQGQTHGHSRQPSGQSMQMVTLGNVATASGKVPPMSAIDPAKMRQLASGGVLDEFNQPAVFVGDVELPLYCIKGDSRAGRLEGWFRLTDPLEALLNDQSDDEILEETPSQLTEENLESAPPPPLEASNHLFVPEMPKRRQSRMEILDRGGEDWCVKLEIRYVRDGFKQRPLPDYHGMYATLARRLIQSEIEQYKANREEAQLSVGAWQQYREKELALAAAGGHGGDVLTVGGLAMPCPTSVVAGNDGNGLYPAALSLPTLCILQEYALRYGIGMIFRKLTLLEILSDYEAAGVVDVDVVQGLIVEFLGLIRTEDGDYSGMTKSERAMFVRIVETVATHQINQLVKYKDCFADARPTGALQAGINFLRFALNLQPFCTQFSKKFAPVDDLLLKCVKDGAQEMYERLSAMAMPEFSYNQKQAQGVPPDTHKMLELAGLLCSEIQKDEQYFNSLWPFDLLEMTVPVYLSAFARDLQGHFEDIDVEASVQVFDLYFRLKELRTKYRKHWDAVGGDDVFRLSEWFMPFVYDWIHQNDARTNSQAMAALEADLLVPESKQQPHSASVGELLLLLHQNVNFLTKLDFGDEKITGILRAKFVQSAKETLSRYGHKMMERQRAIVVRLDQQLAKNMPDDAGVEWRRRLVTCANNTVALRNQLPDVYRLIGVSELILSGRTGGKENPVVQNDIVETFNALKTHRTTITDSVVNLLAATLVNHVNRMVHEVIQSTIAAAQAEARGLSGPKPGPMGLQSKSLTSKGKSLLSRLQTAAASLDVIRENVGGAPMGAPEMEPDHVLRPFIHSVTSFTSLIRDNTYEQLAHDMLLGGWRRTLIGLANIMISDECRRRVRRPTAPVAMLPPEAISAINSCLVILRERFVSGQCLAEEHLDMDGKFGYVKRCLADYHRPTLELINRFTSVIDKPLRENEDITAYLTSQEAVSHIPDVLSVRRNDQKALDFCARHTSTFL